MATTARVLSDLAVAFVAALGAVAGTWWLLDLPASYVLIGAAVYASLAGLVLWTIPADLPGPGMGPANRITLGRAALAVPVFALSVQPGTLEVRDAWCIIALSTVVLILDGFDGRIARRTGTQTEFGARFDMEVDAALIMALSVLVWRSGRVGPWVLLIGLMRYGFVAASWIWPALGAELPPSLRRKVGAVAQGIVLLVALGPIIPVWMAVTVAAAGLALLSYSFAVDVRWALRRSRP
ncbi:MAG: CDP-alcohol phosphatidyltransferase family protein [Gemmatimonadota bacterium]|nr:CDP-alcohol phosphatidyltransferase family protein [Gemmatimonadota bacterium]